MYITYAVGGRRFTSYGGHPTQSTVALICSFLNCCALWHFGLIQVIYFILEFL